MQQLKDAVVTLSPAFASGNFQLAFGEKNLAVMDLTLDKVCSSWCWARFGRVFYPKVDIVRAEAGWLDSWTAAGRRLCDNVVAAFSAGIALRLYKPLPGISVGQRARRGERCEVSRGQLALCVLHGHQRRATRVENGRSHDALLSLLIKKL